MRRSNIVRRWCSLPTQSTLHKDVRWRHNVSGLSRSPLRFCSCTTSRLSQAANPVTTDTPTPSSAPQQAPPADHRVLGIAQELFTTSSYSPGSPLFLPNGAHILNKLTSFLRAQYAQYGFREVVTPNIYKKSLWEISGHWQNYKDDMYEVSGRSEKSDNAKNTAAQAAEEEQYGLKPMNCPGHCLLFKSHMHSYRELPIRYADFSPLHRNEVSGSLSGLTRVRRFHQDDGHIFCRPQQIRGEIELALKFTDTVLRTFGLDEYRLVLSTRPEKDFIGSIELWDSAEQQLRDALDRSGRAWELNEGDGAFYGPKIDLQLPDSDGKFHQLSTIQLDMNLPQRFGLEYVVAEGEQDYNPATPGKATPVLIHRAIFGSLERFFALLIERYNGRWPFWLSPRQGIILTVSQNENVLRATENAVAKMSGFQGLLRNNHTASKGDEVFEPLSSTQTTFRIDVDDSARSLGKKIREAKQKKYNLIFVLGEKNLVDGSVDVDFSAQTVGKDEAVMKALVDELPCWDVTSRPDGGVAKMKMNVDDVYGWLMRLEKRFQ
ncbi:threonine-tRNA ligase [Polytolypa hystricis UAMH7299]|uniref:threonine--tRNA ligase n=1 Tax=Polytolypa hystricis (strain UAMH7299) TaxID=1447883 RepID=A0A2B7Z050_POLH7|nr:threonine-tRNA ligase [Polytolypa hystricis UAMH7299]